MRTLYDTFGNEVKYQITNATLEAYLENATIKFPLPEASSMLLEDLVDFESIDPVQYDMVKSKLSKIGFKEANAKTMASILVQVAKSAGVNPLTYFDVNEDTLKLTNDTYRTINLLRPPGNRIGLTEPVENRKSQQYKLIKP